MKPSFSLPKVVTASALALLLSACASSQMPISPAGDEVDAAPPPPTVTPNGAGEEHALACDLDVVQYGIGEQFDEANVPQLQSDSKARQVRVLRPDDMATMDHRPDRLNIHLDDQDVIDALRCG